jgi:serine/threonine-protein kinase
MECPQCGTRCGPEHKFCAKCGFPISEAQGQATDPLIGKTLPGGHVVLELIDVGGMGRVYRAEQRLLGRTVAVKIIHPHLLGDETIEARFITEARAASQLNHPNSVSVFDFGKADGQFYLVMEYLRGRDLAVAARTEGLFELPRIAHVMGQVLAALEEAHHLGIVHRDLKPENIILQSMRSGGDFVKVVDFGLAKLKAEVRARRITNPGMVCGTPQYMAPEQARGDVVDARTDLYAVGIILYELLTGQLPFESPSPNEVVAMQLNDSPPDPREMTDERDLSDAIIALLDRALAKFPSERFQTASEFSEALGAALGAGNAERNRVSAEHVRCPTCNALVERPQKFCGECGSPMRPGVSMPAPSAAAVQAGLKGRPALVPTVPKISFGEPRMSMRPLPPSFVGRSEDLDWLRTARSSAGVTVGCRRIVGRAGSGRTRLLHEFAADLAAAGERPLLFGPDPWRAAVGYGTLQEAIVELAGLPVGGGDAPMWAGASPEARAGLALVFGTADRSRADVRRRWSDSPPIHLQRDNCRFLAAEALRWALGRASQQAGQTDCVVVMVDDFDVVDGATRAAFQDVVADPPLGRVLLVLTHEPAFEPEWEGTELRELRGLTVSQAVTLADVSPTSLPPLADDGGDSSTLLLPMYVEQVARFAAEGGAEPPAGLADVLATRIERLPADARRVLQAVAVLTDGAAGAQLAAMLPEVKEVDGHVTRLEKAGLVVRRDRYVTASHPLVRDITIGSTPAEVRCRLHSRARQLPSLEHGTVPLEAHALHAYHAQESFEALMLLDQVASRAAERADHGGAVHWLRLGLDLARREMSRGEIDDPLAAIILFSCKLGDVLALAGRLWDADGVLREALDLGGPRSPARPRVLASLAQVAQQRGRPQVAAGYLEEALLIAAEAGRLEQVAALHRLRHSWAETDAER